MTYLIKPMWSAFPQNYRQAEMQRIASWIMSGESGAIVGPTGVGRQTFMNYLCFRPDALATYLDEFETDVVAIPVDLNNLPGFDLATLYRVILRSFFEVHERFQVSSQEHIREIYRRYESACDPFLPQSGLRELLLYFQEKEMRIVLVMNRFDKFCLRANEEMTATLREIRDSFRHTLIYLMGMAHDVTYLSNLDSVAPLYGILDTHICRIGPLSPTDAAFMIREQTQRGKFPVSDSLITQLQQVTGNYPSLLRVACQWWLQSVDRGHSMGLADDLFSNKSTQHRLGQLWGGFTEEEKALLSGFRFTKVALAGENLSDEDAAVVNSLIEKGVCRKTAASIEIVGQLVATYAAHQAGQSRGKLWYNSKTKEIYIGKNSVEGLKPLEFKLLTFMLRHPYKRHTHSELIEAAWPDDAQLEGVTTEALYQVVRGIRKLVEPDASRPRYLINWRGTPEGGYHLYPEGRPT